MKKFLLGMLFEMAFDYMVAALRELAKDTRTTVDDRAVDDIAKYKVDVVRLAKAKIKE